MSKDESLVDYLGDKKFFSGYDVCLVDFILFEFCEYTDKLNGGKTCDTYPTLRAYCERVKNLPENSTTKNSLIMVVSCSQVKLFGGWTLAHLICLGAGLKCT